MFGNTLRRTARVGTSVPIRNHFTYPSPKLLKDIVKLPLLAVETKETIAEIWQTRHENDGSRISATIDSETYKKLTNNGKAFANFIVPVHRENGYTILVSQWQGEKHCLFTGLEAFQKNPTNAHPVAVLTMYDEFLKSKGIVLSRLDITDPVVTKEEMQRVLDLHFLAYMSEDGIQRVRTFNLEASKFDYENYIRSVRPRTM